MCFFFQAEDGIRDLTVTGVQTCALPIYLNVAVVTVLLTMHSRPGTGLRAMGYAGLAVLAVSWRSGRASGRATGIVWLSDAAGLLLVAFALPGAGHGHGLGFSPIFLRSLFGSAGRVAATRGRAPGRLCGRRAR